MTINPDISKAIKPYVLTIAGFDPSSGAGLTSDIKTFEAHNVYGLSVCTSITVQNDIEFETIKWIEFDLIKQQIEILFNRFPIDVVKIGLIEDILTFAQVINILKSLNSSIKIVWDPILKASAGFSFHSKITPQELESLLHDVYLITPNTIEFDAWFKTITLENPVVNILLKGGHLKTEPIDVLYYKEGKSVFYGKRHEGLNKHGTGCVLSSSISANLALGFSLKDSCKNAKDYINSFIASNELHLGYHNYNEVHI